jgi:hypothetical protein
MNKQLLKIVLASALSLSAFSADAGNIVNLDFENESFGVGVTNNGATISTNQSKSGSGSLYLNGNGSYIALNNSLLNLGSSDFSLSFDMKTDGAQNPWSVIVSTGSFPNGGNFAQQIEIGNNPNGINEAVGNVGYFDPQARGNPGFFAALSAPFQNVLTKDINDGAWHSINFQRAGTNMTLSVDTNIVGQFSIPATQTENLDNLFIGKWQGNGLSDNSYRGWIDNFSISTSIAPVPEADTSAMLLMGAGVMGFMARRRKQLAA